MLFPKLSNRINNFGIQNKKNFEFNFSSWKIKKQNGPIATKIVNDLPPSAKQTLITGVLSKPKNPKDYKCRQINENEQVPTYFESDTYSDSIAPKVMIVKKETGVEKPDGRKKSMDLSAKSVMDYMVAKRRAEEKEMLERQLSENTAKMNIIKKLKNQ